MFTKNELKAFRRICDSCKSMDASEIYRIHWQNLEAKRKGWTADINHRDEIKASSLKEALKKLSYSVAFDCGTHNALVVSINTDKTSYQFSGRLDELMTKVKDSKCRDGKYVSDLKPGDIITKKDGSKWIVSAIRKTPFGIQVRVNSKTSPVKTEEITYQPTDMLAY